MLQEELQDEPHRFADPSLFLAPGDFSNILIISAMCLKMFVIFNLAFLGFCIGWIFRVFNILSCVTVIIRKK